MKENECDNKGSIYYIILDKMKREGYDCISEFYFQEYLNYYKYKNNIPKIKEESDNKDNKKKELEILNDFLKIKK